MRQVTMYRLAFGSLAKMMLAIGVSLGIVLGLLMLIVALLGGEASVDLGVIQFTGVIAGIIGFPFLILVSALISLIGAAVAHFPLRWLLHLVRGLSLEAIVDVPPEDPPIQSMGQ